MHPSLAVILAFLIQPGNYFLQQGATCCLNTGLRTGLHSPELRPAAIGSPSIRSTRLQEAGGATWCPPSRSIGHSPGHSLSHSVNRELLAALGAEIEARHALVSQDWALDGNGRAARSAVHYSLRDRRMVSRSSGTVLTVPWSETIVSRTLKPACCKRSQGPMVASAPPQGAVPAPRQRRNRNGLGCRGPQG